jgi:TPR repeat protein
MKANRFLFTVLFLLSAAVFRLPAQQNEADRKVLAEIRAGADKGDAKAQYELGRAFFSGTLGVAKDEAEAVKWFRKAAEQNVADAQYNLGVCYANGQGVTEDDAESVKWFRKAAEQNLADAQYNLGVCYDSGEGVAKDEVEAYKWWLLAAGQGNDDAKYNMTIVENKMSREQIAEGQRLARDFKPRKVPSEGSDARLPP